MEARRFFHEHSGILSVLLRAIITHLDEGPLWTMKWEEELKVLLPIRRRRARYLCACYSWSYHS